MTTDNSEGYVLLNQLAEEFAERYRRGEHPSLEDYVDRHPELSDAIREFFPTMVEVEEVKRAVRETPSGGRSRLPERVGGYRILREIGRGGMGVVYEAEQESLGRRVALKVLPMEAARDAKLLARFRREARAAAQLHHTNIVPVFEVGQDGDICFYVMQYMQGQPLDKVLRDLQRLRVATVGTSGRGATQSVSAAACSRLTGDFQPIASADATVDATPRADTPPRSGDPATSSSAPPALSAQSELSMVESNYGLYCRNVVRLGLQVAEALAYAHGRGIVHRDIKPANLLLDTAATIWVSDFGLAKTEEQGLTETGDLVGTVRYMAPERFQGVGDARGDVYALGLTLYELLLLRPAFDAPDRLRLIDQIGRQEPARLRTLDSRIPRDLETIIMKAIEKEPRRRYPSAKAMAADLRRFLADEPILARRTGPLERLGRWGRRNPLVASLSAAIVLVAALGFAGVLAHAAQAEKERDEVRALNDRLHRTLYASNMNLVQHAWEAGGTGQVRELLEKHRPKPGEADLRNFEWHYFDRLCHSEILTLKGGGVAYSPDGKRLASASYDSTSQESTVKIWDAQTGQQLLSIKHNGGIDGLVFSPDGKRLASVPGCPGDLKVWDAQTGQVLLTLKQCLNCVVFSPDGKQLASPIWDPATKEGAVTLFDAQTGQKLRTFPNSSFSWVAFSPDGKRLASPIPDRTAKGGAVKVWDVQTGQELLSIKDYGWPVVFSPDGRHLAIDSDQDNTVRVWDAQTAQKLLFIKKSGGRSENGVAYSPDGKRLASTDQQTVKVWDAQTGQELLTLKGHTDQVLSVAFSPDGKHLASASLDGTVKVWDAQGIRKPFILLGKANSVASMAFSPDGKHLASGGVGTWDDSKNADAGAVVQVWDAQTGQEMLKLKGHTSRVTSVAFSPDSKYLASGSGRVIFNTWPRRLGEAKVWDAQTGHELFTLKGGAYCVTYSPDGKRLATGTDGGQDKEGKPLTADLKVWDAKTGQELLTLKGHTGEVVSVAYSPDGKHLASGCGTWDNSMNAWGDVEVKVWDAQTGKELHSLRGHTKRIMSVVFSPDSKRLASASEDRTVKVWDAQTGEELLTLKGHTNYLSSVVFSPDGKRLVSVADDKTVKVWDAQTGQELLTFKGDFRSVAFTPDGHRLASGTNDGTVTIWDARPLPEKR
jgi:WD40 repeat protein/serine/threonine protein kinase